MSRKDHAVHCWLIYVNVSLTLWFCVSSRFHRSQLIPSGALNSISLQYYTYRFKLFSWMTEVNIIIVSLIQYQQVMIFTTWKCFLKNKSHETTTSIFNQIINLQKKCKCIKTSLWKHAHLILCPEISFKKPW